MRALAKGSVGRAGRPGVRDSALAAAPDGPLGEPEETTGRARRSRRPPPPRSRGVAQPLQPADQDPEAGRTGPHRRWRCPRDEALPGLLGQPATGDRDRRDDGDREQQVAVAALEQAVEARPRSAEGADGEEPWWPGRARARRTGRRRTRTPGSPGSWRRRRSPGASPHRSRRASARCGSTTRRPRPAPARDDDRQTAHADTLTRSTALWRVAVTSVAPSPCPPPLVGWAVCRH